MEFPFKKYERLTDPWSGVSRPIQNELLAREFIDRETTKELIHLFYELLLISSPSGAEAEIRNSLILYGEKHGLTQWECDREGNLLFGNSQKTKGISIALAAHMDTFALKKEKMSPIIAGNRIVNRNASILGGDNRIGLAVMMLLGIHFIVNRRRSGVRLLFTAREESHRGPGSRGAKNINRNFIENLDLILSMDVPSGKSISQRNFLVHHMLADDPLLATALEAAEVSGIPSPYLEWEKGGYIGGDATAFYREHKIKVIDFGSGNFNEHTRQEYTDLTIALEQARWIYHTLLLLLDKR